MSEGEKLYRSNCATCHYLRNPRKHSDEEWPHFVKRYGDKIHLTSIDQEKILEYLQSNN